MTVLQIPDLSRMRVKARAHELDAMRLRAGQEAQVVLDMYPEETLPGRIEAVANAPANRGRSATLQWFEVQVLLDRTDPGRMRPGMSARLRVFQDKREDALLAPRQAVFEEEDGHVLYVAEGSGRFRAHPVTPTGRNDLFYALADGPPAGSEVALRRPGS
jgi:multidrug efflux pump subunit AcrA (membrane-fusion protein)